LTISKELTPLDDSRLDELLELKRGEYRIITTKGDVALHPPRPVMRKLLDEIGADIPDTVILRADRLPVVVMVVDDNGHAKGRAFNMIATQLYHRICMPGTKHTIAGDVAIVNDSDFHG
jgi:hypothetical protein